MPVLIQADNENRYRLNRFYKRNGHKGKSSPNQPSFWLEHDGKIQAAVRFEEQDGYLLMRGLWVAKDSRGMGLGAQILTQLAPFLAQHKCFCLPFSEQINFYHRNHFIDAINHAPEKLQQQHQRYIDKGQSLGLLQYQPPVD